MIVCNTYTHTEEIYTYRYRERERDTYIQTHTSHSFCLFINGGTVGLFLFLVMLSNASMEISVKVLGCMFLFLLRKYLGVELHSHV